MNCLITGANGFAGKHLARLLTSQGHLVTGVGRQADSESSACTRYLQCDLRDPDTFSGVLESVRPDCVYHLATPRSDRWSLEENVFNEALICAQNIFEAIQKNPSRPRILIASSCAVYAQSTAALTEADRVDPIGSYASCKLAIERMALEHGLDCVIARPFNHIGPGQPPKTIASAYARAMARLEKNMSGDVIHVGHLSLRKDFIDVRDVVTAYALLMQSGQAGEIYNVCSGRAITFDQLLSALNALSSVRPELIFDPSRVHELEPEYTLGSHEKITPQTGWIPRYDVLSQSVPDMLNYWRTFICAAL